MSFANDFFQERWLNISKTVTFNPSWNNGTGYLDHAVHGENQIELQPGEIVKSITGEKKPRRVIFVGTFLGPVAVFERGENERIACNLSDDVRSLKFPGIESGNLSEDALIFLIDQHCNIGNWIEKMRKILTNKNK